MLEPLLQQGWAIVHRGLFKEACIEAAFSEFATKLQGSLKRVEHIRPKAQEGVNPESLSGKYGFNAFPLHCDTAHWPVPCRYIVIACLQTGNEIVPTRVLPWSELKLEPKVITTAQTSLFFVRNGRRSFYSTIASKLRTFWRLDPGCMQPLSKEAEDLMMFISDAAETAPVAELYLNAGDMLLIDNWRCLHGRGPVTAASYGRHLFRGSIL